MHNSVIWFPSQDRVLESFGVKISQTLIVLVNRKTDRFQDEYIGYQEICLERRREKREIGTRQFSVNKYYLCQLKLPCNFLLIKPLTCFIVSQENITQLRTTRTWLKFLTLAVK